VTFENVEEPEDVADGEAVTRNIYAAEDVATSEADKPKNPNNNGKGNSGKKGSSGGKKGSSGGSKPKTPSKLFTIPVMDRI
jgi:hypothetical protein